MHTLTLSFPTLGELLAAAAAVAAIGPAPAETEAPAFTPPRPADAEPQKQAPAAAAAKPAKPAKAPKAEAAPVPAPAPAKIAYPELQKAVFALAGKVNALGLDTGEHVLAIAQALGGKTFKDLPAEKWADALAAVQAKQAELDAKG